MASNTGKPESCGGRLGPLELSFRDRIDTRDNSLSRLEFQRLVQRVHDLGPAPLARFLREVEAGANVRVALQEYTAPPGDLIRAAVDCFPPSLHLINGGGQ